MTNEVLSPKFRQLADFVEFRFWQVADTGQAEPPPTYPCLDEAQAMLERAVLPLEPHTQADACMLIAAAIRQFNTGRAAEVEGGYTKIALQAALERLTRGRGDIGIAATAYITAVCTADEGEI